MLRRALRSAAPLALPLASRPARARAAAASSNALLDDAIFAPPRPYTLEVARVRLRTRFHDNFEPDTYDETFYVAPTATEANDYRPAAAARLRRRFAAAFPLAPGDAAAAPPPTLAAAPPPTLAAAPPSPRADYAAAARRRLRARFLDKFGS